MSRHGSKVMAPLKKAPQEDLAVYCPETSNLRTWASSLESSTSTRVFTSWNNSKMPTIESPLCISRVQFWFGKASTTNLWFRIPVGTAATTKGARSATEQPKIHLSFQKRVSLAFPIFVYIAIWNKATPCWWTGISKQCHDLSLSIFLNHNHRVCSAQPMIWRVGIPSPPRSRGLWTLSQLPSHKTTSSICLLPSFPEKTCSQALTNHLIAISTCMRIADITNLTQTACPAMFVSFVSNLAVGPQPFQSKV